jgi:hypothetical protein
VSEAFNRALARYETTSRRHEAVLKSWRAHPDKAEPWRAFKGAAANNGKPDPVPADFIGVVLGATMPARRLNNHSQQARERFEKLKLQLTDVVNEAIYPRDLWRDLARFETALRNLDRSDYDMHAAPAGGRKDVNQSRDRKLFALRILRYFEIPCGQPPPIKRLRRCLTLSFPMSPKTSGLYDNGSKKLRSRLSRSIRLTI